MKRLIKASLRPVRNLLLTMFVNIMVCGLLFELTEPGDHGPIGGPYWAVVTGSSTGYGDILPTTLESRLLAIWMILSGLALFAVTTAQITAALVQDPHLFSDAEQEELKDDTDDILRLVCLIANKVGVSPEELNGCVEEWDEYTNQERNANG